MTQKEFANLKVGDKVKIKKSVPKDNPIYWSHHQDRHLGNVVTIRTMDKLAFKINEDRILNLWFSYKLIDEVVVGAVATKHDNIEPAAPEERIKQLEDEIKALKEEQKNRKEYEKMKKAGSEINAAIEGLVAGGLSREEAFGLVKTVAAGFAKNPLSELL